MLMAAVYTAKKELFGQEVEIILHDIDRTTGDIIADDAFNKGLRHQKIFNFFDIKSELSSLNTKRTMKVSKELLEVIKIALELSEFTDGQYDISIGKQILQRKSNKTIDKIDCSYKDIEIMKDIVTLKHQDVLIDLSSLAKGHIGDEMVKVLKSGGIMSGLLDARGDIIVFGNNRQKIAIQHPRDKERVIGYISAKNSAIATSGDYNQYHYSYKNTHILNNKDLISVTVIAKDLMTADLFATAFFVADKAKRDVLIKKDKSIKIMSIDKNMNIKYYNGFENIIVGDMV